MLSNYSGVIYGCTHDITPSVSRLRRLIPRNADALYIGADAISCMMKMGFLLHAF